MTDLTSTVAPKSDQLNADDLIGRTLTIRITRVSKRAEPDQPIAINFEGDNGKPYLPCKSMRRTLMMMWGAEGNEYVGRRMTLYRDDKVMFGGVAVGGIRISHMSDIRGEVTFALTASKTVRKPYTVKPLPKDDAPRAAEITNPDELWARATEAASEGRVSFGMWWKDRTAAEKAALKPRAAELGEICDGADNPFVPDSAEMAEGAQSNG